MSFRRVWAANQSALIRRQHQFARKETQCERSSVRMTQGNATVSQTQLDYPRFPVLRPHFLFFANFLEHAPHDFGEDFFFVLEVMIQRRGTDPQFAGNSLQAKAIESVPIDQFKCGLRCSAARDQRRCRSSSPRYARRFYGRSLRRLQNHIPINQVAHRPLVGRLLRVRQPCTNKPCRQSNIIRYERKFRKGSPDDQIAQLSGP